MIQLAFWLPLLLPVAVMMARPSFEESSSPEGFAIKRAVLMYVNIAVAVALALGLGLGFGLRSSEGTADAVSTLMWPCCRSQAHRMHPRHRK